jgi:hypothetical protein
MSDWSFISSHAPSPVRTEHIPSMYKGQPMLALLKETGNEFVSLHAKDALLSGTLYYHYKGAPGFVICEKGSWSLWQWCDSPVECKRYWITRDTCCFEIKPKDEPSIHEAMALQLPLPAQKPNESMGVHIMTRETADFLGEETESCALIPCAYQMIQPETAQNMRTIKGLKSFFQDHDCYAIRVEHKDQIWIIYRSQWFSSPDPEDSLPTPSIQHIIM